MNKPKNQSVSNITCPTTDELNDVLDLVLSYFNIPCPNEKCKDDEDAFLTTYNSRIECNMCDDYSTEAFTIKLEFD